MDQCRRKEAVGLGQLRKASKGRLDGWLRQMNERGRRPYAVKCADDIRQMTNIGLNQCQTRVPMSRIMEKRAIEVQSHHAKPGTLDLPGVLACAASKIEQMRLARHTLKHID